MQPQTRTDCALRHGNRTDIACGHGRQRWETRILIFALAPRGVVDAIEEELEYEPERDARLAGFNRRTLQQDPAMGTFLCYLTANPETPSKPPAAPARPSPNKRRQRMLVRDGMNPIVVTVGLAHMLREATRRMTARGVGAAVVTDDGQHGPSIITECDILNSNGVGQGIDTESVRDHVTSEVVYAAADWSLKQAAAMVKGGFRHIIVVEGSDVAGILSMRDIVSCWISDGACCELTP